MKSVICTNCESSVVALRAQRQRSVGAEAVPESGQGMAQVQQLHLPREGGIKLNTLRSCGYRLVAIKPLPSPRRRLGGEKLPIGA